MGVKTVYIESVVLGRMAFVKALMTTFTDNPLNSEYLYSLKEAKIIVKEWVMKMTDDNPFRDNHERPYS